MKRGHETKKIFQCDYCEKTFTDRYTVKTHTNRVHFKKKDNKCDSCEKAFCSKSELNWHREAVHVKLKNFKCEFCTKSFSLNTALKTHISRVHEKKYKYECYMCNKSFVTKAHLRRHEKIPHCNSCGEIFSDEYNLWVHAKEEHDFKQDFKCEFCQMTFDEKLPARLHLESAHNKRIRIIYQAPVNKMLKSYQCTSCNKSFATGPSLKRHENYTHGEKNLMCDICDSIFSYKQYLKRHMKEVHDRIRGEKCTY